jgi:ATP-binding cassette subfamily F protein uup
VALLVNCQQITKSYGSVPLFEDISVTVSDHDRLGLIGPNGSGKSTLLRILAGIDQPDAGVRTVRKLTRIGYVPQDSFFPDGVSVAAVLRRAAPDDDQREHLVNATLGLAGFRDPNQPASSLSGGWRKRLAIAGAIIAQPDLLLLDEPTNHLDLAGILWLEELLAASPFALVAVSHDRYFLERVATSMAELSRQYPNGLFRSDGSYSVFLEKRAAFLAAQQQLEDSLAAKVRREVEWLRRGAKARTTKAKARIDQANRLISELDDVALRNRSAAVQLSFSASHRQTRKLLETESLGFSLADRVLLRDVNLSLRPGARLGLVGPNGSGKTTLLRLLLGELQPSHGAIFRADNLRVVYFDQHREQLDLSQSLKRALAQHGDSVIYNDRVIHVAAWAKRFLFRHEQLEVALSRLSGGERARVLLARLMLQPADVLLLDEPTNDLDIPTLEVLEESLLEFPGAIVLVTHDRFLLDRVATALLGIDATGAATLYASYAQWLQAQPATVDTKSPTRQPSPSPTAPTPPPARKKLSYLEAREWESIEPRIHAAEAELERLRALLQSPEVTANPARLAQVYDEMLAAQAHVDRLYDRWAELEAKLT